MYRISKLQKIARQDKTGFASKGHDISGKINRNVCTENILRVENEKNAQDW